MPSLKNGFTLIELLVVIAIIALLASIALVSFNQARAEARDSKRLTDIKNIHTALEFFYEKYNEFPHYGYNIDIDASFDGTYIDQGRDSFFLPALADEGYFSQATPIDPLNRVYSSPVWYEYGYIIDWEGNLCGLDYAGYAYLYARVLETEQQNHGVDVNCPGSPNFFNNIYNDGYLLVLVPA